MEQDQKKLRSILWAASVGFLAVGIYAVIRPVIKPVTWSAILVVASWPLFRRLQRLLPKHAHLAALIMTLGLTCIVLAVTVPLIHYGATEVDDLFAKIRAFAEERNYELPSALRALPVVGDALQERFHSFAEQKELSSAVSQNTQRAARIALRFLGGAAKLLFSFVVFLFTSFFFYLHGETLAKQLVNAGVRVGGGRYAHLIEVIRKNIKGSVYGVLATALAQGTLAGIGFAAAGSPVPLLLGFATFVLSVIPFGAPLIYIPVVLYIASSGNLLHAGLLLAWCMAVVSSADNVLRPYFISQATQGPILLVFVGIIGGISSFGMLGIFIGPAILAVAQSLWLELVREEGEGRRAEG